MRKGQQDYCRKVFSDTLPPGEVARLLASTVLISITLCFILLIVPFQAPLAGLFRQHNVHYANFCFA